MVVSWFQRGTFEASEAGETVAYSGWIDVWEGSVLLTYVADVWLLAGKGRGKSGKSGRSGSGGRSGKRSEPSDGSPETRLEGAANAIEAKAKAIRSLKRVSCMILVLKASIPSSYTKMVGELKNQRAMLTWDLYLKVSKGGLTRTGLTVGCLELAGCWLAELE